jgi:hypothetical protein
MKTVNVKLPKRNWRDIMGLPKIPIASKVHTKKATSKNTGLSKEFLLYYKDQFEKELLMTGELWYHHLGSNLTKNGSHCGPQRVWDVEANKGVPLMEHPYIIWKVKENFGYMDQMTPKTPKVLEQMDPITPKVLEPEYKSLALLLLGKIKDYNEEVQRDRRSPLDINHLITNPFMRGGLSMGYPPCEIDIPHAVKEWQDRELESTEEGRKDIGKKALAKLSHQERKVLNLNRPFKEIDAEYLSHERLVKENDATLKQKKEELEKIDKQLRGMRYKKPKTGHTNKHNKLALEYEKMHKEYHAFKEALIVASKYLIVASKYDKNFYE